MKMSTINYHKLFKAACTSFVVIAGMVSLFVLLGVMLAFFGPLGLLATLLFVAFIWGTYLVYTTTDW